jgi:hypothetical protein
VRTLRHSTTIEGLAESQGVRADDIRSLHESALAEMKRDTVIMAFLPIFADKKTREFLCRRDPAEPGRLSLIKELTLVDRTNEVSIVCPACNSLALHRCGHVHDDAQRYIRLMYNGQFVPGRERIFPKRRPVRPHCGRSMNLFKSKERHDTFP